MSRNDISFLNEGAFGIKGSRKYKVTSGTTTSILAGEPVMAALGSSLRRGGGRTRCDRCYRTDFLLFAVCGFPFIPLGNSAIG